jgi:hypothetical protein
LWRRRGLSRDCERRLLHHRCHNDDHGDDERLAVGR